MIKRRIIATVILIMIFIPMFCGQALAATVKPYPYKQFTSGDAYTKSYASEEYDTVKLLNDGLFFSADLEFNGYVKNEGKYIEQKAKMTLPGKPGFIGTYHYYDNFFYIGSQNEEGHCRITIAAEEDATASFDATVTEQKKKLELEQSGQSMSLFSWRTSDKNSIETPLQVTTEPDGSVLLTLHLLDEWDDPAYGYNEIIWTIRVFRIAELPGLHFVASCKYQFGIGTGRFLGDYDEDKHGATYKSMIETHNKEKAEFLSLRTAEYITDPSNYKIEWLEPKILQDFDYADVTQNALTTPGEDGGVAIPVAVVVGVLGIGAAVAGAAAASAGDGKGKKKAYKMYVQKDFGDAIRRGAENPYIIRARMAEIDEHGKENDRNDLTAKINVSSEGMRIHGVAVSGRYCEATVSVSAEYEEDTAKITFSFAGEGGVFTNNIIFRIVDGPTLKFLAESGNPGEFLINYNSYGIEAIPGDGFTYDARFMIVDAPVPPDTADISAVNTGELEVSFEKTDNQAGYKMSVYNNTKPETDYDIFAKPKDMNFEIHVIVEGEKEPVKGYVTVRLYPEGITVDSRDIGKKNDIRYVRVQAYEKDYVGDLDKKWQVSEMKFTLAVKGTDRAIIDPPEATYEFEKLKGTGGLGMRADKEQILAEKYEYKEAYGMYNDKMTYDFEPNANLEEPEDGTLMMVMLPVGCTYDGMEYQADIPLRLRGKDPEPMGDWEKEYKELERRIEKFAIPENRAKLIHDMKMCALEPKASVEELRLTSKWILREYMAYWTTEQTKAQSEARTYNIIVNALEWAKFAGDCAFSFLINAYAGPVADALLSPAKDFATGAIGEVIAAVNYGESLDISIMDRFEFSKNLAAAGENLVSNSIDLKNWKTAAATLGGYFVYCALKNYILKLNEKGESDIWGSLCEAFKDLGYTMMKSKAGDLIGKWLKESKKFQEKIGPAISKWFNETSFETLQKKLNDSLGLEGELRKLAGYANDKIFEATVEKVVSQYLSSLAGAGFDKLREVYDSSKFVIEDGNVYYCFNLHLFDALHYGIKLNLTTTLQVMSGDLANWFYDYFFAGVPTAESVIEKPKDPPLPPPKE
ncbi:MAG: hypothetical protein IJL30_09850 [Clostridia bacterium]|nr:hypothetical protein [Clostridia bacterium]